MARKVSHFQVVKLNTLRFLKLLKKFDLSTIYWTALALKLNFRLLYGVIMLELFLWPRIRVQEYKLDTLTLDTILYESILKTDSLRLYLLDHAKMLETFLLRM